MVSTTKFGAWNCFKSIMLVCRWSPSVVTTVRDDTRSTELNVSKADLKKHGRNINEEAITQEFCLLNEENTRA